MSRAENRSFDSLSIAQSAHVSATVLLLSEVSLWMLHSFTCSCFNSQSFRPAAAIKNSFSPLWLLKNEIIDILMTMDFNLDFNWIN